MSLLRAENLAYGFSSPLLKGLNLTLSDHELLLVSGPNGVGKSTLVRIILGFPPARIFAGQLQCSVAPGHIAWLPQLENPEFHLPLTLRDVLDISLPQAPSTEAIVALGLLRAEHLGLPWNLASGGERKRTLLTRALLHQPRLLLLDEPLNHLDTESRALVVKGLGDYLAARPAAAVVISHDAFSGQELSLFRRQELKIQESGFRLEVAP